MKMKKNFTSAILFIFVISNVIKAQTQVWDWGFAARGEGNASADQGYAICTDNAGNCYVTGSFGSAHDTFGTTIITNTSSELQQNIFIAEFNTSGNLKWVK